MSDGYTSKAEKILESYNIDKDGLIAKDSHLPLSIIKPELSAGIEEKQIRHLITEYNRGRDRMTKLKYASSMLEIEEGTAKCCYISVDDIGVRFQKSKRKQKCKKGKSFVENTVIHIQSDGKQYTLTAVGMDKAFKLLIAFLLENKLMEGSRLIFFSDGATCIRDTIEKYFGFRQYTLVLDWLHLEKKCNEFLSMGIKGAKDEKLQINKRISTQIICIIARIALPLHKIICNDVIDRRLYIYKFLEAAYSCSCVQSVGPLFIFYIIINSK